MKIKKIIGWIILTFIGLILLSFITIAMYFTMDCNIPYTIISMMGIVGFIALLCLASTWINE